MKISNKPRSVELWTPVLHFETGVKKLYAKLSLVYPIKFLKISTQSPAVNLEAQKIPGAAKA